MSTEQKPSLGGVWALTWRSILFLPAMLFAFILLLALAVSLFALPLFGGVCIYFGLHLQGLASLAIWLVLLWAWRRFNLRQFYEGPPSYL